MSEATTKPMSGLRKAAILLRALDEDYTVEVMQLLSPHEIQTLSLEMAALGTITHAEMHSVISDFFEEVGQFSVFGMGSNDYIRSVLVKVLGEERAASLLEDIMETAAGGSGIDALNMLEASSVAEMIKDEHPQIIATILVHLDRNQATSVLEMFDESLRGDVMLRIATFSGVQPSALQELTEVLSSMLDGQNLKRSKMGGVKTAAELLNLMNSSVEEEVLNKVRSHNEELAQNIVDNMFLFENIIDLDNASLDTLINSVEKESLAVALKGTDQALIDKIVGTMSERAGRLLLDDMEARGPMRLSQVEQEQKAILQVVKKLADSGDIVLSGGDDTYV